MRAEKATGPGRSAHLGPDRGRWTSRLVRRERYRTKLAAAGPIGIGKKGEEGRSGRRREKEEEKIRRKRKRKKKKKKRKKMVRVYSCLEYPEFIFWIFEKRFRFYAN